MFDSLSSGLEKAWDIVRKDGKLTADNIKAPMREIRRALLEADVSAHLHGWRQQHLHAFPRSCGCSAVHACGIVLRQCHASAPCQFDIDLSHNICHAPAGKSTAGEPAGGAAVCGPC